jgi:hypothetical protein
LTPNGALLDRVMAELEIHGRCADLPDQAARTLHNLHGLLAGDAVAPRLSAEWKGRIWVEIRDALRIGEAIAKDCEKDGYEVYSAKLDAEARKRTSALMERLTGPHSDLSANHMICVCGHYDDHHPQSGGWCVVCECQRFTPLTGPDAGGTT